jgi:hypothetical protein
MYNLPTSPCEFDNLVLTPPIEHHALPGRFVLVPTPHLKFGHVVSTYALIDGVPDSAPVPIAGNAVAVIPMRLLEVRGNAVVPVDANPFLAELDYERRV